MAFVYSITFSILNLLVYPKLVVEDNASDFQGGTPGFSSLAF